MYIYIFFLEVQQIILVKGMRGLTFVYYIFIKSVAALIELSRFRLPTITSTLLNLLDSIKVSEQSL